LLGPCLFGEASIASCAGLIRAGQERFLVPHDRRSPAKGS
jgi:hypothetical protein